MEPNHIHRFIRRIVDTQATELDCTECASRVPEYVEAVLAARDGDGRFRAIREHLFQCEPCQEEYDALREVVNVETEWLNGSAPRSVPANFD